MKHIVGFLGVWLVGGIVIIAGGYMFATVFKQTMMLPILLAMWVGGIGYVTVQATVALHHRLQKVSKQDVASR